MRDVTYKARNLEFIEIVSTHTPHAGRDKSVTTFPVSI